MAVCPKCQNKLKEDFGLETCKKCGEVVFINMDDSVTLQEIHQEMKEEEITEDIIGQTNNIESSLNFNDVGSSPSGIQPTEESSTQFEDPFAVDSIEDNIVGGFELETLDSTEDSDLSSLGSGTAVLPSEEYGFATEETEENEFDIPDAPLVASVPVVQTSADDFLDEMQAFGEMDSDKFKEGIYFFDVEISNIDSKETRDQIIDELEDSRLNLKIENISKKIVKGILLLPALPAVKAHVVVQKISHLSCDISWKLVEVQNLIVETEPEIEGESEAVDEL